MERKFNFLTVAAVVIFASASVVFIALCCSSKTTPTKAPINQTTGAETKEGIKDNDNRQSLSSSHAEDNPKIHTILVNMAHTGNCPTRTPTSFDLNHGGTYIVPECGATCDPSNHLSMSIFADNEVAVLKSKNRCLKIKKTPMASNGCKFATSIAVCSYAERQMFWFHSDDSKALRSVHTAFEGDCKTEARLALRQTSGVGGMEGITVEPEDEYNDEFFWTEVRCQK